METRRLTLAHLIRLHRLSWLCGLCWICSLSLLGGCASDSARIADARTLAALAPKLGAYHELTERYRYTYQRQQPFLSAEADAREREIDRQRQAACDDFVKLQIGVQAYLQALGRLAGEHAYDFEDQVKAMSGGIKAWPDTGLNHSHVNAYAGLTRLLMRALTGPAQERAVGELLHDGYQSAEQLLGAMETLLQLYRKTSDNEAAMVLGMLETELPFLDARRDRLLIALARVQQQDKRAEYHLIGLRSTLAQQHLAELTQRLRALQQQWAPLPTLKELP